MKKSYLEHGVCMVYGVYTVCILEFVFKRTFLATYRAKKATFVQHLSLPPQKLWPHTM